MKPNPSFFSFVAGVVLSVTASSSYLYAAEKAPVVKTIDIGTAAPAFKLKGVDDKEYSLQSFKEAKYLVVIFTCNHCPDARASWGRIDQFTKDYAEKGVQVVAISSNSKNCLRRVFNWRAHHLSHCSLSKAISKQACGRSSSRMS